ncbi:MAG: flagellar assembly protein FliH [Proteobacteria bacterium]|nr:flagellar assembly protein FliH [Pseudomonadota bacterium]
MRRFAFETVFDDQGAVAFEPPAPKKRAFTVEEIEAARAEGYAQGERSAVVKAEAAQAAALREIAGAITGALGALAGVAHTHKEGAAALSLVCARAIADAALDCFPQAPAEAALRALTGELETTPRLIVRTGAGEPERLRQALERVADEAGLTGAVQVKAEPGMARAAFIFDWGDGRAAYDPEPAAARVREALAAALAAEGLHGDALHPSAPNPSGA